MKLKLIREPVTQLACATYTPEPHGSLIWCYARWWIGMQLVQLLNWQAPQA